MELPGSQKCFRSLSQNCSDVPLEKRPGVPSGNLPEVPLEVRPAISPKVVSGILSGNSSGILLGVSLELI
jgi:hypothetical protein